MERFETVASRALQQLNILLSRSESPLTAMQLLQMTAVCLFAVHNAPSTGTLSRSSFGSIFAEHEPGTCSLQQQRAVQLVISIWSLFLCRLDNELTNIEEQLLGKSPPSAQAYNASFTKRSGLIQLLRVLPSLHLISEWMSTPTVAEIYRSMPSLEPVDPVNCPDTWKLLARVCNRLATMDNDGYLAESIVADTNGKGEIVMVRYINGEITKPRNPGTTEI